jgi:hypothetical protein
LPGHIVADVVGVPVGAGGQVLQLVRVPWPENSAIVQQFLVPSADITPGGIAPALWAAS